MTLPSELRDAAGSEAAGLHAELLDRQPGSRKFVSRLEFLPAERVGVEVVVQAKSVKESEETESRLKEEVAALNGQLEQAASRIDTARSEAVVEARREWELELEEKILRERESVLRACEQFGRERVRYFVEIEAEVVRLALAIAARVLHREAKLDPLLLSAAVRVALEKVAEDSATVLRVPVAEVELWRGLFLEQAPGSPVKVVGDERLNVGECVLDTNVGKVELGVSAQLSEIERGFFDLLQKRPA
jgi:flagellar assembly protein FliH